MVEWYTHWSKKPAPFGLRVQVSPFAPNYSASKSVGRRPDLDSGGRRFESYLADQKLPEWWNGIHVGLRNQCLLGLRVQVSPLAPKLKNAIAFTWLLG